MVTFSAILAALTAFFKMIPALKNLWDSVVALYIQQEYANMIKQNQTTIKKALEDHDQREIEKLLDPNSAGLPSGLPGSVVIPGGSLPNIGVKK